MTFVGGADSGLQEECPVGRRTFAILFIIADQASHPLLDVLRKPKSNQVLSNRMGSNVLFGEDHELKAWIKDQQPCKQDSSRAGFSCTKHTTDCNASAAFIQGKDYRTESCQYMAISKLQEGEYSFFQRTAPHSQVWQTQYQGQTAGVMQQCATWYVAWGLTDGERRCTGFHTLVSIFLWACARRLRALVHSWYPPI